MAIVIKSIPVLKDKAAETFNQRMVESSSKKYSIDFSNKVAVSTKIIAKAKF